jgi:hypothetical protein
MLGSFSSIMDFPTFEGTTNMKFTLGITLLIVVSLFPANIRAQVPAGRWEIVHTSGDNSAQTDQYPGSFSTFLNSGGTGYTYGTFTNSLCVIDAETYNVVPTWTTVGVNAVITITVDNLGLGPNFSFIYTGTYDPLTPIPSGSPNTTGALTGTYSSIGDVSACNSGSGNFTATFLPTISSGLAMGSLDGMAAVNGSPFDATVSSTISFSTPPANGQIAGTVALAANPTFHSSPCFATTGSDVNPLTINSSKSSQSGTSEYIFAEGLDPLGVPTTLILNGASVNLYTTSANTDPNATQITTTEWAATAAIGEDNPAAGFTGVSNDGANTAMAFSYGVIGGVCNDAGGVDAPFFFLPGKPIVHGPKKQKHRGNGLKPDRDQDQTRHRRQ